MTKDTLADRLLSIPEFIAKCSDALTFRGSRQYWERRYASGRKSGAGSYGRLAQFKAEVLNSFVADRAVQSVIELGVGDGNQLSLAKYPSYIGLDVSSTAVELCRKRFNDDRTKSFFLYDPSRVADHQRAYSAELALSLDVIYHLVEDTVYETYMTHLFTMASRFVIIYSSDMEDATLAKHVKHRKFTSWVSKKMLGWELSQRIQNRYPHDPKKPNGTSFSDFYVYASRGH